MANRPNTALLVIDVQNDVVEAAFERDAVVSNINQLVSNARSEHVPVIWVQHDDEELPAETHGWQIVPELVPDPDELIIRKNYRDSFDATDLEAELGKRDVGRLIVTGAQTDYCVRWTLQGALSRGYDTVLASDAHTTDVTAGTGMPKGEEIISHTNSVWGSQTHPTVDTSVQPTNEITF